MMKSLLRNCLALALAASMLPALADQIILYERANFSGRNITVERNAPNLAYQGFGNRASSAYVMSGTWELCTEPYFQGSCRTLPPGEYRSLGRQNDQLASLRPVDERDGNNRMDRGDRNDRNDRNDRGDRRDRNDSWNNSGGAEAVLYDGPNFQGQLGTLRTATPNFERLGFNDKVASIIIRRGTWEFCTDANYRNNCRVYGPGQYPEIWGGQDDKYSSARPVEAGWGNSGNPGNNNPGKGSRRDDNSGGWSGSTSSGSPRIRFFEYTNFGGRSIWVRDSVVSFEEISFNDRAESMIVEGGEWRLCSDAHGQGNCQTFRPGQYPVLPQGLRNSVSSAYKR